jgi:hypothetical protein
MDFNVYYMQVQSDQFLREACAAAARRAMLGPPPPVVGPALRRALDTVRALYARWSSAASAGSKPTTARAWSRSR